MMLDSLSLDCNGDCNGPACAQCLQYKAEWDDGWTCDGNHGWAAGPAPSPPAPPSICGPVLDPKKSQQHGNWSHPPTCASSCGPVPGPVKKPLNVSRPGALSPGSEQNGVTYTCDYGFCFPNAGGSGIICNSQGTISRECLANKSWAKVPKRLECTSRCGQSPGEGANMKKDFKGNVLTYHCEIQGDTCTPPERCSQTCKKSGGSWSWSGAGPPECECASPIKKLDPDDKTLGKIGNIEDGTAITWSCEELGGKWSKSTVSCTDQIRQTSSGDFCCPGQWMMDGGNATAKAIAASWKETRGKRELGSTDDLA